MLEWTLIIKSMNFLDFSLIWKGNQVQLWISKLAVGPQVVLNPRKHPQIALPGMPSPFPDSLLWWGSCVVDPRAGLAEASKSEELVRHLVPAWETSSCLSLLCASLRVPLDIQPLGRTGEGSSCVRWCLPGRDLRVLCLAVSAALGK